MDFMEHKTVLFNKIRRIEPDIANKIIGYLLLRLTDEEMISLGMSTDAVIQEVIHNAKIDLSKEDFSLLKSVAVPFSPSINSPPAVSEFSPQFSPFSPVSCRSLSSPTGYHVPPTLKSQIGSKRSSEFVPMSYQDSMAELQNQAQFLSLEDSIDSAELNSAGFPSDFFYSSDASFGNLSRGRRHFGLNENSLKICHYYNKGYCKHGSSCRYFHGQLSEHSPRTFDVMNDDHIFSPGSLERLESEIVDLLRSRKGNPVSIASLPMMYYERYRKVLQADGYLTESQRHGKAGFSLTKLLAKLKNSIRLIDRPHGQHSVILVEDVPRYLENRGDRSDPGPIVSGSRQIYLTFPAESTFTEDDVSNYFSTFGQVEDVRIPCQQKRMFGFVTFESSDTVKTILAKGNPHFVCNARVLVKPYREKSKLIDRKFHERIESSMYFSPHYVDMDSELHSVPRGYESSRLLRKQLLEEQEQYELERRQRLAELRMRKTMPHQSYFGYSLEGLKVPEDNLPFSSSDGFNDLFDFLTNSSANEDKITHVKTSYTDQDSQGLNLPESPFASAIAST